MKRKSLLFIILLVLIGIGVIWFQSSITETPGGAIAPKGNPTPVQPAESGRDIPNTKKEGQASPAQGRMELSSEDKQNYDRPANGEEFNETMKRQDKGIKITPGITFEPGKGINVKKPGTEESIQIRRDNSYRADEYKVQWEKKF